MPRQADAPRQEIDSPSGPPPRRKSGAWKYIVAAVATAVAGLVVIGLLVSGDEEPAPKPSKKPSSARAVPSPNAEETQALLEGLGRINPDLKDKRYVAVSREICQQILINDNGDPNYAIFLEEDKKLIEQIRKRFGGQVNTTQAGMILRLIRGSFCHI